MTRYWVWYPWGELHRIVCHPSWTFATTFQALDPFWGQP